MLALAACAEPARPVPEPTVANVRLALAQRSGYGVATDDAEADLRAWGARALPALEELARRDAHAQEEDGGHAIVCALIGLDRAEAGALLVAIVCGETGVGPHHALDHLAHETIPNASIGAALADPRARAEVIAIAETGTSSLERRNALRVVAAQRWPEAEPAVRALLACEDPALRDAARAALDALASEPAPGAIACFPRVRWTPDLFGEPIRLRPERGAFDLGTDAFQCRFGTWFDGRRGIVAGCDARLELYDADGDRVARVPVEHVVRESWLLHDARGEPVLAAALGEYDADHLAGIRADGSVAWLHEIADRRGIAPIHRDGRPYAVATDIGAFAALDAEGAELWSSSEDLGVHVASHPALPGLVLTGRAREQRAVEVPADEVRWRAQPGEEFDYLTHGRLFPDVHGAIAVVLAGSLGGGAFADDEVLARYDSLGREVWRTILPGGWCNDLVLIEPEGRRPLIAAAIEGRTFVLDEDGVLLWIIEPAERDSRLARHLSAGAFDDGTIGLLVQLRDPWLYRLDPAALDRR